MELRDKKVTVVGLARSGVAATELLLDKGAKVSITDCRISPQVKQEAKSLKGRRNIVHVEIGKHSRALISGQDLIVVSPGVSLDAAPILWAKQAGITVIGEIELAFAFCPSPIIAITGTNGKTTVTTLLGEIFRAAARQCVICGNIGNPFSAQVLGLKSSDTVILEISSFQLETIDRFRPKLAAILNLTIDHLDRHADIQQYLAAKARIFSNQTKTDWALLNAEDPYRDQFSARTDARVVYFPQKNKDRTKLNGLNNNHFAALAISSLFTIPVGIALPVCKRFKGIAHRLEQLGQIRGVEFINDSKATNVDSTLWALEAIKKPIILIAGGRDKGSDYSLVKNKVKENVRAAVLLGEAGPKIKREFKDLIPTYAVKSLEQGLKQAVAVSHPGDCVLLSPMCSSFDMFKDYTERGRLFKAAVRRLVDA